MRIVAVAALFALPCLCLSQEVQWQNAEIIDFVCKGNHSHGIDYHELVNRSSAHNVEALKNALTTDNQCTEYIVYALGIIGYDHNSLDLVNFFMKGEGKLTETQYRAKKATFTALGILLNHTGSRLARDFLERLAKRDVKIAWIIPGHDMGPKETRLEMSLAAILALGMSGEKQSEQILTKIRKKYRDPRIKTIVDNSRRTNLEISSIGLGGFYSR